jgi:hypothetical protein
MPSAEHEQAWIASNEKYENETIPISATCFAEDLFRKIYCENLGNHAINLA